MNKIQLGFVSLLISLSGATIIGLAGAAAVAPPTPDGLGTGATSSQTANNNAATGSSSTTTSDACAGLAQLDGTQGCKTGESSIKNIVKAAVNILSYIVGVAAVIMVIIAGFKYIKSNGDSNNISSSKSTLVYALIGLAIAALAQVLVHFVLNQSTAAANNTKAGIVPGDSSLVIDA